MLRMELPGASPGQLHPQRSGEYLNATCGENCTTSDTAGDVIAETGGFAPSLAFAAQLS